LNVTRPISGLIGTSGANVVLQWNLSGEIGAQYVVCRSLNGMNGPFVKFKQNPINTGCYIDHGAPSGPKVYQVRALRLVTTGSGSYSNLCQGVFTNVD